MTQKVKKSTIYDIAREANLSIGTVSRVLNKKGSYSQRAEQEILRAMERLNYLPNSNAQNLALNNTRTLGLVLSPDTTIDIAENDFILQFLNGVTIAANRHNYDILLYSGINDTNRTLDSVLNKSRFDGIIMTSSEYPCLETIQDLIRDGFPAVYVGSRLDMDDGGHNIYGGFQKYKQHALELLYSKGYQSIVCIESYTQSRTMARIETFRRIIEEFRMQHGLNEQRLKMILYDSQGNLQLLLRDVLTNRDFPYAIYADCISSCTGIYNQIHKLGYRIPEDIGIISTSHLFTSGEEFSPPLSTMYVDAFEMGKRSVELLLNQIEGQDKTVDPFVPYRVIDRKSLI